jgi:hypothetical protein
MAGCMTRDLGLWYSCRTASHRRPVIPLRCFLAKMTLWSVDGYASRKSVKAAYVPLPLCACRSQIEAGATDRASRVPVSNQVTAEHTVLSDSRLAQSSSSELLRQQ